MATKQQLARARAASYSLFAGDALPDWRPEPPPVIPDAVRTVYFDTETTGLKWMRGDKPVGYALAWFEGDLLKTWYGPVGHAGGNLDPDLVIESLRGNLRGRYVKGLHVKFDAHQTRNGGIDLEALGCTLGDVAHDAALLNEHRAHFSLEAIAQDVLGMGKVTGVDPTRMTEYHASQVDAYARRDVELCALVDRAQTPKLATEGLIRVRDLEDATLWPVIEMERNGALMDVPKLKRWLIESERDYLILQQRLKRVVHGYPFNPNEAESWARLFHVKGLPVYWTAGKTPKVSTAEEILEAYDDPDVRDGLRLRKLGKLRGDLEKYHRCAASCDGLLYSSFNQLRRDFSEGSEGGTLTGRFSSAGYKFADEEIGTNEQQIANVGWWTGEHRDVKGKKVPVYKYAPRETFVAPEGMLFAAPDAMQIEFRIFASYAESAALDAAYREDPMVSFHNVVWEIVKRFTDIEYKQLKNTNFCKLYGGRYRKIARMTGMSPEEAQEFVRIYDQRFPDAERLLNEASRVAQRRGFVKTLLGRRGRFPTSCTCGCLDPFSGRVRWHAALNKVIQGSAADILKSAAVECHRERKYTQFKMRMTIHDQFAGEVPDAEHAGKLLEVLNRQLVPLRDPIKVLWDMKTGKNWAEC